MRQWFAVLLLGIILVSAGELVGADNAGSIRIQEGPPSFETMVRSLMVKVVRVSPKFEKTVTVALGIRGFTGVMPPEKAAFCFGVLAAEGQYAEIAGDEVMKKDVREALLVLIEDLKLKTPPQPVTTHDSAGALIRFQPAIDEYLNKNNLKIYYDLGRWAEAMRFAVLAAVEADRSGTRNYSAAAKDGSVPSDQISGGDFLKGPENRAEDFLAALKRDKLPEGIFRSLEDLKNLKARQAPLSSEDRQAALQVLETIVSLAGEARLRTKEAWIRLYGEVNEGEDPVVDRARNVIFPKIWAASRKPAGVVSELVVIKAQGDPWTFVLRADGAVMITRGAVYLCYQDVPQQVGDARLAFLVGHELSHLANGHFWHAETFDALKVYGGSAGQGGSEAVRLMFAQVTDGARTTPEARQAAQVKELQADQEGLIACSMAGYDPKSVLSREGATFFDTYVDQITEKAALDDATHPTPRQRADFLRTSLTPIVEALELFTFGVRLYELARYEDALILFGMFSERYPGREVQNNIGLCQFQLAQGVLENCDASLSNRFSIPVQVDTETRAALVAAITAPLMMERSQSMGVQNCYEKAVFKRHMARAVTLLNMAVEKDPLYLPARINLSSALIVNREYDKAGIAAREAVQTAKEKLKKPDGSPEGMNNRALALYLAGAAEDRPALKSEAVALLQSLARQYPEYHGALYNLGSMELEMGLKKEGDADLRRFVEKGGDAPLAAIAKRVLGMRGGTSSPAASRVLPDRPAVRPGLLNSGTREELRAVQPKTFPSSVGMVSIYIHPEWTAYLIKDNLIIVEKPLKTPLARAEFLSTFGRPLRTINTAAGEVLIYGSYAADVKEGRVLRLAFFERM
jgi:tetratricopeptide (TPR) repeat protein